MTAETSGESGRQLDNLRQAFKLALALTLFYWLALTVNWELPHYGAIAIILVSLGTSGATLEKGFARVIGTTVGVLIGIVLVTCFHHDRWTMLLAFCVFLILVSYCMQESRNSYAWYVTAFLPLVIWGGNYPDYDNTFYFGTFRWLQTATGVVIYTVIDLLFWPKSSSEDLQKQGDQLWKGLRHRLNDLGTVSCGNTSEERDDPLSAKDSVSFSGMATALQQSFYDTAAIKSQKRAWLRLQSNTRALVTSLELAEQSVAECGGQSLQRKIPELSAAFTSLVNRLDKIQSDWRDAFESGSEVFRDTTPSLALTIDRDAVRDMSEADRAAVACFRSHVEQIDLASRRLLGSFNRGTAPATEDTPALRAKPWTSYRGVMATFPAVAFAAAFLFWIYVNPPTGPKVPMMAGILGLMVVRTPMSLMTLAAILVLSVVVCVAPIYWLVMPTLSGGFALLALLFSYSLFFGFLGGINPVLKIGPVMMFVNMTGISNDQSYSFQALVDGGLMMILAAAIPAVVQQFYAVMRPEYGINLWTSRFFRGAHRFVSGAQGRGDSEVLESMVLPAPPQVGSRSRQLNHKLFPEGTPESLLSLQGCMQQTADWMVCVDSSIRRHGDDSAEMIRSLEPLNRRLEDIFRGWSSADARIALPATTSDEFALHLRQQLESARMKAEDESPTQQTLVGRYTVLGTFRGLVESVIATHQAMVRVDWKELSLARF